ncbi:MAG: Zn-dependent exopeptidase M28 [Planctomycetes bacterium]|nr:Zn-dependent exopeptidase M28 [Planctomycetota bacterium]
MNGGIVRATTWMALALGGFGACLGAALTQQRTEPAPQTPQPGQHTYHAPDEVDKKAIRPLPPVRAPEGFGETAFAHVRTLVGFGPRYSGQPGWTQQLDHIEATCKELGLEVRRDTWTDRKELLTFSNVSAVIPGKRKERILLACHHDTKCTKGHPDPANNFHFVGANDGASGVAVLLALAPLLQAAKFEATIELVFFDGEESLDWKWNDAARALFGSRRYVKKHRDAELTGETTRIAAMILLDMVGRTDLHLQDETYSTKDLRQILWSAAVALGHDKHVFQRAESAADDHKPFLDVGIPAIDLIDLNGNPHWHKPTDTIENMSPASLQVVADLVLTMLPEVERQYVLARR